ncbi:MAG: hypothetical protein WCR66_05670 [Bacteroidota bacterium]
MKQLYTFSLALFFSITLLAQSNTELPDIPPMRLLHHEFIIESLKKIDTLYNPSDSVGKQNKKEVDSMILSIRIDIEKDSLISQNEKFKWLRSCNEILTAFIDAYQLKQITISKLPASVKAFRNAMNLDLSAQSVFPVFETNELSICNVLINNFGIQQNIGLQKSKDLIVFKYCQQHPENILMVLNRNPDNEYADSLIIKAAFVDPEKLYNYAAASNELGLKIQSNGHPLVKIISQLSATKTGRMYIPFLDKLYHGTITTDSITAMLTEQKSEKYYKLLVATRIEYTKRMQQGDTALLVDVLTTKLKAKAIELYINDINGLHELKDLKLRFKKLDSLSAQELYYLAVLGEQEMYTSSFVSGIYPRIFQKMTNPNSDSLLLSVNDDYFKKFIKIAATYNTLDDLLKNMDSVSSVKRMQHFVDGLEHSKNLEEAVDVADSYASIYQPYLRTLILQEVQSELNRNKVSNNNRGIKIYQLMQDLFLSIDTANHIDLSAKLGIAPVYSMPLKRLQDSSGKVVMQLFFYGDKDGANIFAAFVQGFQNGKWRIQYKPEWVEITARKGIAISIFANRPLDSEKDLDDKAQINLSDYLKDQNLQPSIVIHRGHSYYLNSTIEKLAASAQLVILGGCGGYQNLNEILEICPDAHIISTKQMGTGAINKGMINEISERLRLGQDLDWPTLWNNLAKQITKPKLKEAFEDYIPPHKNLGAIFIMAFNKMIR